MNNSSPDPLSVASAPYAVLVLSVAVGASGCAIGSPPHIDPQGFIRARSAHFVVHTDADEPAYERVIDALESTHAALKQTFFPVTEVESMNVILLADDDDFEDLVGANTGGIFTHVEGDSFIVAPVSDHSPISLLEGEAKTWLELLVAHELAHRFIDGSHPQAPHWFHEGFATFLETVVIRDKVAAFGVGQLGHLDVLARGQMLPLSQLLDKPWQGVHGWWHTADYASAWALFHYVTLGLGPRQLNNIRLAMHESNDQGSWGSVVSHALAAQPLDHIDEQLRTYVSQRLIARVRMMRLLTVAFQPPGEAEYSVEPGDKDLVRKVGFALKTKHKR